MKLSQYKEKKNHKKIIAIALVIVGLIGGVILDRTFANFKVQKSFKVMEGNFIYEGSGDIIFAFYQDGKDVGTMPSKDSGYVFYANKSSCDNDAEINWDKNEWGPNIRNLIKTKTKCNLYFVKAGTLRKAGGASDREGMWNYKSNLTKIVIETIKNKKVAGAGQIVHGPFDESEKKDGSVESYVVCDTGDTNCIGYLQGEGGIDLNSDSSYLFNGFFNVTQIEGMENLYTSNIIDMSGMFNGMINLEELDLSNFYTRHVNDMSRMFYDDEGLQELNLSSFDTSSVTNMNSMFSITKKLKAVIFGENFDTSSVTNMYDMFYKANSLQQLNISNWNTSNVTDMGEMFFEDESLQELDLSSFDTSNVTNMKNMFAGARKLTKITYGQNFVHNSLAVTTWMFASCLANKPDENVHPSWSGVSFN